MKFYKDSNGIWHLGDRILPPLSCSLLNENNGYVSFISQDGSDSSLLISDIQRSDETYYGTLDTLLSECSDFFVKPQISYGEIYGYNNSSTLSVPTGATYTKALPFNNIGKYKDVICSSDNDNLTIEKDGLYRINASFSSSIGTNNVNLYTSVFVNGIQQQNITGHRFIVNSNYKSTIALTGLLNLSKGDIIDVRVMHDNSSSVIVYTDMCNMNIVGRETE